MTLLQFVLWTLWGTAAYLLAQTIPVPSATKGIPIGIPFEFWMPMLLILLVFAIMLMAIPSPEKSVNMKTRTNFKAHPGSTIMVAAAFLFLSSMIFII